MNAIFPTSDNNLIYTLLNNNQETLDLARMRAVCRKWKEIVDYISRNLLLPLGIKVDREGATVHIIQITFCFNRILRPELEVNQIEKVRKVIPRLTTVTQLKCFSDAFMIDDSKSLDGKKFSVLLFRKFMDSALAKLSDIQVIPTFKAVLINQSKDIVTAAIFNSEISFFHIYTYHHPTQSEFQEALLPACRAGNFTFIKTLVVDLNVDPTKQEPSTETYLTACCGKNCYKGASLLLSKNADTNTPNQFGETPIAIAAKTNKLTFDLFSDAGADLNEKFGVGNDRTLAHFAAEGNNFKVIEFLHSKGIDIDERNNLNETPLMIAIRACAKESFEALLKCGALISKKCGKKTLAHFAAEGNNADAIYPLYSNGIGIDEQNERGLTPLIIAIRESNTPTFYRLLECGASLTKKCNNQYSPLDYAVMRDNVVFLEVLIEMLLSNVRPELKNPRDDKDNSISKSLLKSGLQTAIGTRNLRAINMISKALGWSTPIKYTLVAGFGAFLGGLFVLRYYHNGE